MMSLNEFLADTGWPKPAHRNVAERMTEALAFFQSGMAEWCAQSPENSNPGYKFKDRDGKPRGASPLAFKQQAGDGPKVTNLTCAMQAINFTMDVAVVELAVSTRLVRYGTSREWPDTRARGRWFTNPCTSADELALLPGQSNPFLYVVTVPVSVLKSHAGDLLVDWDIRSVTDNLQVGMDYHYRHGGGIQYTISDASTCLRPLFTAPAAGRIPARIPGPSCLVRGTPMNTRGRPDQTQGWQPAPVDDPLWGDLLELGYVGLGALGRETMGNLMV